MFILGAHGGPQRRSAAARSHYIVPCRACRKMRMPAAAVPPYPRPARGAAARIAGGGPH